MPIVTTDIGLRAIADAEAGGFRVNIHKFAVTEAEGVVPKVIDTALVGAPVYGPIEVQSIEVVNSGKVKFTLFIPQRFPTDGGSKRLTEVGLYLESGELFAHGTFKTPFDKTDDFGLRIVVFVVTARLGEVINFTFGTNSSLASAASVRTLIDPVQSDTNAVVVQDAQTNIENVAALTAGSLAVRYGAGGLSWAFLGYDLNYRGFPTRVGSHSAFSLLAEIEGGFWASDKEVVIVQIVAGAGAGESRRVQYDKRNGVFNVLEKPFSGLSEQSLLHIWRSTKNALPARTAEIESYYVLGHGVNSWKKEQLTGGVGTKNDLIPTRIALKGDGARTSFPMPQDLPDEVYLSSGNFMVYVGGDPIALDQFSVSKTNGVTLLARTPGAGEAVEITVFKKVVSDGSSIILSYAEYDATGVDRLFYTSIVPLTSDYLWVYVEGKLIASDQWVFSGSSVTFTNYAPNGKVVLVSAGNLQELGASTTIVRAEHSLNVVDGVVSPIDLGDGTIEKKNTIVSVANNLISQTKYDIDREGRLQLSKDSFYHGDSISVVSFAASIEEVLVERHSGENSGPVWIDPAGSAIGTNRIEARAVSYIGSGSQNTYSMNSNGTMAFVFMDGNFQDPSSYAILSADGMIVLPQVLERDMKMDIISFQIIPHVGEETHCQRQTMKSVSGQRRYQIAPSDGPTRQVTLVSISGVYQHFGTYDTDGHYVEFDEAPWPDMDIEFWHFGTVPKPGNSNAMSIGYNTLRAGQTDYIHEFYDTIPLFDVGLKENTVLFASTVFQYGKDYSISNDNAYIFNIPGADRIAGVKATSIVFYSGKPKSRLMLREEMPDRYMTRDEILKLVGQTQGSSARMSAMSVVEAPSLEDQLAVIWKILAKNPEVLGEEGIEMLGRVNAAKQ